VALPVFLLSFLSCNHADEVKQVYQNSEEKVQEMHQPVSPYRETVSEMPVAGYSIKTDDALNDWYFKLDIFETPETFKYLMKFQFEEIRGEDTLKFPHAGKELKPVVQKGPEQYSAIIGFEDPSDGSFKEYKKLFVENGQLKLKILKRYAAFTK
jgi:hypothetical protein